MQRPRVGQQDRGVEHVAAPGFRALCASSRFDHGCSLGGRGTTPTSPVGRPALARTSATPPRTPARAGCRPSRVCNTTTRASRAVRIGYGPPRETLPAVTRVRSTATPCRRRVAPGELTQRTTVRRRPSTVCRRRSVGFDTIGRCQVRTTTVRRAGRLRPPDASLRVVQDGRERPRHPAGLTFPRAKDVGPSIRPRRACEIVTQRRTAKRYGALQVIGDHAVSIDIAGSGPIRLRTTARKEEYPHAKYLAHPMVLHSLVA